jgi:hypothetical protein
MATASYHRCGAGYRVERPYPLPVDDPLTAPSPEVGVKHTVHQGAYHGSDMC